MNKKPGWTFDNTYTHLPEIMFSRVNPVNVKDPKLVLLNEALAKSLGLDFTTLSENSSAKSIADIFSGNSVPHGAEPIAQAYAGHQFGNFTVLGDGRAILLGEHLTPEHQRVDIQLKGSGRTPYSRQGDGRAAFGPMLREYIISEAMHALGIPTTRSLAVVTTGEEVIRETPSPGAILTRVAASHIRVGTFEYAATYGDIHALQTLVNYSIERHYPHLKHPKNPALELLTAVMDRQISLIIHWMRVGFIHGVMNTDNMAISGESIDYGPCAFMNGYNPNTVFSSIDRHGRYAFENQPKIVHWNLTRFAEALLPLLHDTQEDAIQLASDVLNNFATLYQSQCLTMMREKLGLFGQKNTDEMLVNDLLSWMQESHADYTNTFCALMMETLPDDKIFQGKKFLGWHHRWQVRQSLHTDSLKASFALMRTNNPVVIPRNHKVEEVLRAATVENDLKPLHHFLKILSKPYKDGRSELAAYQTPPEEGDHDYRTFCGT